MFHITITAWEGETVIIIIVITVSPSHAVIIILLIAKMAVDSRGVVEKDILQKLSEENII